MKRQHSCLITTALLLSLQGWALSFEVVPSFVSPFQRHQHSSCHRSQTVLLSSIEQQSSNTTSDEMTGSSSSSSSFLSSQVLVDAAKSNFYESEDYEVYSRSLSSRKERDQVISELEKAGRNKGWRKTVLNYPGRLVQKVIRKTKPGKLILLRCGESTFNANGTFTGWLDPDLTPRGVQQCQHAAALLQAEGFDPDVVYTSRLKRAIKSTWVILEELQALYLPVYKTFRLNQRMYGVLQGLSKEETAAQVGINAVNAWRNSLKARPPPLAIQDPNHPCHERRYSDLSRDQIPSTESLLDCQERARPLWEYKIKCDIEQGKTVLVVAHRDALRGLIKSIDGIGDAEIEDVRVPKCVPFVYRFQEGRDSDGELTPVRSDPKSSLTQKYVSATFLETPASLKATVIEQQDETFYNLHLFNSSSLFLKKKRRASSLHDTLEQLRSTQNLLTTPVGKENVEDDDDEIKLTSAGLPTLVAEERWTDDPSFEFEEYEYDEFSDVDEEVEPVLFNIVSAPELTSSSSGVGSVFGKGEPCVVLIRHGRTPHNNLGLFTGWEDPPLAEGGVEDARNAGRILKRHNFEFDVVYTSWLTRAIQTAYYALDELDCVWIPMVKSWRLNERMYGDLTGKSKKRVANDYGEDQLKKWRRGYTIRPPPTSSYSPNYPGNDQRRTKHFDDLGISWGETINRSFEQRKIVVHRKFPKTESLKDCMERSIPFYTKEICKAVDEGKRVMITSHENAIRGILMHLCGIPESAMNQLHLPNGLPLVYNVKGKCITLLDDGSGMDPMEVHDFGPAAKYLFKPCELDDDFYDSMLNRKG